MKANNSKKLCWNCEGEVSLYAIQCPYCGNHLGTDQEAKVSQTHAEPQPAYQQVKQQEGEKQHFNPLYPTHQTATASSCAASSFSDGDSIEEDPPVNKMKNEQTVELISFFTLISGTVFLLFGLLLFVSSNKGYLILRWDTSYWPVYLIISFLSLAIGWNHLKQLERQSG